MKKILPAMFAMAIAVNSSAHGQKLRVPPEVNKTFVLQYPLGHLKRWKQKNAGYIATFRQKGETFFACYTSGGSWIVTESSVKWTRNLPDAVRSGWKNCKYKDWLILDMKRVEKPGQTLFAIHVGQVQSLGPDDADIGTEYILFFSDKGELKREERQP